MSHVPPEIVLRRATIDDVGEMITVQRAAFLIEAQLYGHPNLPPLMETLDEARAVFSDGVTEVVVAELVRPIGPRIVGAVRVTIDDGAAYIGRLAVAPDLMGAGVGSQLLQYVHDNPPVGVDRFTLYTAGKSESNQRWYVKRGYRPVGIVTDDLGIEIVAMERLLPPPLV